MVTLTDEQVRDLNSQINQMVDIIEEQSKIISEQKEKLEEYDNAQKLDEAFDLTGLRRVLNIEDKDTIKMPFIEEVKPKVFGED